MKELTQEARMRDISALLPNGLPYSSDVMSGLDAIEPPLTEIGPIYKHPLLGNLFRKILPLLIQSRAR